MSPHIAEFSIWHEINNKSYHARESNSVQSVVESVVKEELLFKL